MGELFLFAIFPYISTVLAIVFTIYRYKTNLYSITSFSSEFLESKKLYWGAMSWHYGIVIILLFHFLALVFPGLIRNLLGNLTRLYVYEIIGLGLAFSSLIGLIILLIRRIIDRKVNRITGLIDYIVLVLLLIQVLTGIDISVSKRFGSLWSLDTAVPWLLSLIKLNPEIDFITNFPFTVKLHFFNAFLIIMLLPFTKLIHILSLPIGYLTRPYQIVIWNRRR